MYGMVCDLARSTAKARIAGPGSAHTRYAKGRHCMRAMVRSGTDHGGAMTANYQHLALALVQPGMTLSDELLDVQGHVLLPQGTVLTEAMITLMPRHGIAALPIVIEAVASQEELAAGIEYHEQRLARLFRRQDPDDDADWATALLRSFVTDYRLGMPQEPVE